MVSGGMIGQLPILTPRLGIKHLEVCWLVVAKKFSFAILRLALVKKNPRLKGAPKCLLLTGVDGGSSSISFASHPFDG